VAPHHHVTEHQYVTHRHADRITTTGRVSMIFLFPTRKAHRCGLNLMQHKR